MVNNPQIDIMLPYWGEFSLAKKAIDSVLAQTSNQWRLVVLDDCYPSLEIQKYCKKLNNRRIVYHRHPENIGVTANFNASIEATKSEFCVIMGCDDILLPNYVETALAKIGNADFYQPGVEVIDGNDRIYFPLPDRLKRILQPRRSGTYSGEALATSLARGNWLYFPSIMWRTAKLKQYRFDSRYKIVQDVRLEFDMIMNGAILVYDKTTTFKYRRFAGSVSSKEKESGGVRFDEEARIYNELARGLKRLGWKKAARAARQRIISRLHRVVSS